MEELTAALRKAIDNQMAGKTTLIEALIAQKKSAWAQALSGMDHE